MTMPETYEYIPFFKFLMKNHVCKIEYIWVSVISGALSINAAQKTANRFKELLDSYKLPFCFPPS